MPTYDFLCFVAKSAKALFCQFHVVDHLQLSSRCFRGFWLGSITRLEPQSCCVARFQKVPCNSWQNCGCHSSFLVSWLKLELFNLARLSHARTYESLLRVFQRLQTFSTKSKRPCTSQARVCGTMKKMVRPAKMDCRCKTTNRQSAAALGSQTLKCNHICCVSRTPCNVNPTGSVTVRYENKSLSAVVVVFAVSIM